MLPVVLRYRWRHLNPPWTGINLVWHAVRHRVCPRPQVEMPGWKRDQTLDAPGPGDPNASTEQLQLFVNGLCRILLQHVSTCIAAQVTSLTTDTVHPPESAQFLCWQVRMMCQFVNVLDVTVLPIYRPSTEEVARPELFAANVRRVFVAASGMRAAEQSQREFLALTKVQTLTLTLTSTT